MTAWDELLACSSLSLGDAWTLITHPKTSGGGTTLTGATYEYTLNEEKVVFAVTESDALQLNVTEKSTNTLIVDEAINLNIEEQTLVFKEE